MRKQGVSLRSLRGLFAVGVCLAGVLMLLGAGGSATAQQGQGKFLAQASERLADLIGKANGKGYKLANNRFSLGGGWLKQGSEWVNLFTIELQRDTAYRFLAAGDDDALDVDLRVVNPADDVVAKDATNAKTAQVDYTPTKTLRYKVQVRVYASVKSRPSLTIATVMTK